MSSDHNAIFYFYLQFNVVASDQSNPVRTQTAFVIIDIVRDTVPPQFIREPYFASVFETASLGTPVYTVTATDADLKVRL